MNSLLLTLIKLVSFSCFKVMVNSLCITSTKSGFFSFDFLVEIVSQIQKRTNCHESFQRSPLNGFPSAAADDQL